jgi:TRAP-type mannitol/chloroaromatic compound transport system permease small subunit
MILLLRFSNAIEALLSFVARTFAWAFIACIAVIVFDVVTRKFGYQLPGFGSTRLQELEWQLHAVLFCSWLGYAYMRNAHVRIDIFVDMLNARRRIWIELIGCLVLALPYLAIALPYAHDFFMVSFLQNESSDSPSGLPYRWIVKFVLYAGIWGIALAVFAVMARCIVALFGPAELAALAKPPVAGSPV